MIRPTLVLAALGACGSPSAEQAPVPVIRADPPVVVADAGTAAVSLANLGDRAVVLSGVFDDFDIVTAGDGAVGTRVEPGETATILVAVQADSAALATLELEVVGLAWPPASRDADPEPASTAAGVIAASIPDIEVAEAPAILLEQVDDFALPDAPPRAAVFVWGAPGLACFRVRGDNETPIALTTLPSPTGEAAWGVTTLPDERVAELVRVRCEDGEGDATTVTTPASTQGAPNLADVIDDAS